MFLQTRSDDSVLRGKVRQQCSQRQGHTTVILQTRLDDSIEGQKVVPTDLMTVLQFTNKQIRLQHVLCSFRIVRLQFSGGQDYLTSFTYHFQ